jgi:hypothetical protein
MTSLTKAFFDAKLGRWRRLGQRIFSDGSEWIGQTPDSEFGWLHELFAPADQNALAALVVRVPELPKFQLFDFYSVLNGINLFSSNFYLFGNRDHGRTDQNTISPWDLGLHHYEEISNLFGRDGLVIGGSDVLPNGVKYVENLDRSVDAFDETDWSRPMYTWPSLEILICSEIDRLDCLYGDNGQPTNERFLADFSYRIS